MKRLVTLAAKDLRFLGGWIALWLVAHLAVSALGFWVTLFAAPADREAAKALIKSLGNFLDLLLCAQGVLVFVLCVVAIQTDRLVGPSFWRTRPIAPVRLAAAKALVLVSLLLVVPLIALLPWWLHCDLSLAEMAGAFRPTVQTVLLVAVPSLFVASVVDSLARSFLWGLVAVPVYVAQGIAAAHPSGGTLPLPYPHFLVLAALVVVVLLLVDGKHRRSRFAAPLGIFLAGITLTLGLMRYWVDSGGEHLARATETARTDYPVTVRKVELTSERRDLKTVTVVASTAAPPAGNVAVIHGLSLTLPTSTARKGRPPGLFPLANQGFLTGQAIPALGLRRPPPDLETEKYWEERLAQKAVRRQQKGVPAPERWIPGQRFAFPFPAQEVKRWTEEGGRARGEATVAWVQPILACETRLTSDGWSAERGLGLRIAHRKGDLRALMLVTVESQAARRQRLLEGCVVINREGDVTREMSGWNAARTTIGGVEIVYRTYSYGESVIRGGEWRHVSADELGRRHLARIGERVTGYYVTEFTVPVPKIPD